MDNDEPVEMLAARVPKSMKTAVDHHQRPNQEVVRMALRQFLGDSEEQQIRQRIDEKEQRISQVKAERNSRERELEELRDDVNRLREQLDQIKSYERQVVEEAVETFGDDIPPEEGYDHAAAKNWAEKAGMTPKEFWDKYSELWREQYE